MKRILRCLRDRSGNMLPLTAAIFLIFMLLLAFGLEYWRFHAVQTGAYNAVRSGLESTITENAATLYSAQTDMGGGAYDYINGNWSSDVGTQQLTQMLASHLGLTQSGSDWVKQDSSGNEAYRLCEFSVQISNPERSGSPATASTLTVTASFTLQTTFCNVTARTPMKVSASVGEKF